MSVLIVVDPVTVCVAVFPTKVTWSAPEKLIEAPDLPLPSESYEMTIALLPVAGATNE